VHRKFREPIHYSESPLISPAVPQLHRSVNHRLCGLLVFWAPYSSGKTFALKSLTRSLRSEGKYIIYLDGKNFKWQSNPLFAWLRVAVGLTPNAKGFEEYLPYQNGNITTIIVDHFEDLMKVPDTGPLFVGLARVSRKTKRFNILVAVSSAANAKDIILWNGHSKIRLACRPEAARWDAKTMRNLALGSDCVQALSEANAAEVVECAVASGSPGKVEELASLVSCRRATETILAEWEAGIQILSPYAIYP
jgi:hypothetical protein